MKLDTSKGRIYTASSGHEQRDKTQPAYILELKQDGYAGSERAGQRPAVIQTLLGTAKLNDLGPAVWLKETLKKLSTLPNSRIDELLCRLNHSGSDPDDVGRLIDYTQLL